MTTIRPYRPEDAQPTLTVFLRAIRMTAAADYSPEQIAAWTGDVEKNVGAWAQRRGAAETWIAEHDGTVVGFTDLDQTGYIDMMFVDPAAARTGVATSLLRHVRDLAQERNVSELTVNASATARPLFEGHGFAVRAAQDVERNGVVLRNYRMSAPLTEPRGDARWLPPDFTHPLRVEWGDGVHLRPIRASDVDIDMPAVMNNRDMLWEMYGDAWGWPPATMTAEQDIEDLQHHADEMDRHESFNYAILPADENELFGCIYIDPVRTDDPVEIAAEVSWWVTPEAPAWLSDELGDLTSGWIREAWPFTDVVTPFNRIRFRKTR
jgi:GNAT superfamily N-acetyltransferase